MLRDEYFRRLVDSAHVDLYLSANDGARIYWPWRMQPPCEANDRYRNACEEYIIDSDFNDESVTNEDVLDTAFRLDAEVAALSDVYRDKEATVGALLSGMETYDDHPFDGKLLLPLQEPFVECYEEIGEPPGHIIGIGGLKDHDGLPGIHSHDQLVSRRIEAAHALREAVGVDTRLHGFGWGPDARLAAEIRENPILLDSLDYSSPVTNAPWDQTAGKDRSSVTAAFAGYQLVRDLRECSSLAEEPTALDQREESQQGLGAYQ